MKTWSAAIQDGLRTGAAAAFSSLAALALLGRREQGSAAAPVNAVSHIVWGRRAFRRDGVDARHTLSGLALHVASGLFWGVLYEKLLGDRGSESLGSTVGKAALASGTIATIDLGLVPQRLSPGFERRLSSAGTALAFAALAVGFVVGTRSGGRR